MTALQYQLSVDGESDYGKGTAHLAYKTNTVIVNQDTRTNPLMKFWKDKLLEQGLNSNCAIPITKNGEIHYIILIYSKISNFFSSQMLPILRELKDDIEFALAKIHMQKSLKNSIRFYNTLSQINQLIIKSSSKKDVIEKLCDIFIKYGDFDLAGLFLLDDKRKLKLTHYASKDPRDIDYLAYANEQFQNAQENWPTIKAKNKKHIFINNDTEQNKNLNVFKSKMLEHKLFSSCALPIMQNNKPQGVINLYSKKSHIFDKNIYNLFREIVGDISYALDKFESQKWIQIFSVALNSSYDFVVIADCKFNIVYINDNTLFAFGYKKEELIGKNHRIFSSGLHTKEFVENFYETLKNKKIFSDIFLYRTKNGQIVQSYTTITPYEFDNEIYYVAIGKDLSKDKGLQLKLNHHINFNPVTDLPNQKHFLEKIEAFVQDPIAKKYKSALIIIDPKDFANINTFYGFSIGDEVLKEIAKRLKNNVKSYEIAARLYENKFGLFVKELQTKEDILSCIENSRNILSKPFATNYGNIYLEFSIGISFFPDDAKKAQELLSKAYVALKHAKEGRYIYKFYQKSDEESLIKRFN